MADDSENTCSLCCEDFDRKNFEPIKLPCCHTFCSKCLERIVSDTTIICPNDRYEHLLGEFGIYGLPLDSSKLTEIDRHEARARSTTGSVNFSSDFVDPPLSPRPVTALSTTNRQAQRPVSQPGMGMHYINPPGLSDQRGVNRYPDYRQQSHWSYPPYNHQQPVYSNATYVNAPTPWHSPYQWSYYFRNQPTQQLSQQMMISTVQTTVTQFGGGHNLNVQTQGGNIQIRNGGNSQMISIAHNF